MSPRMRRLVFVVLMAIAGALGVGAIAYYGFQKQAESEVVRTGNLIMETALGIRNYTNRHIKPELDPLLEQRFLPQTVPSFSATEALGYLATNYPDYRYKEAAIHPTNPRDKAAGWEEVVLRSFIADDKLTESSGRVQEGGKEFYYTARPIRITDPTCLRCHSTPAVAPKTMIAAYGAHAGFGWRMNDVVAAQIVTVPVAVPQTQAIASFARVAYALLAVFLVIFAGLVWLLRRGVGVAEEVGER